MFKSKTHFGLAIHHNVATLVTLTNKLVVNYHIFPADSGDDTKLDILANQIAKQKLTNQAMHFAVPAISTLKKIIAFNLTLSAEDIELELASNQKHYFPEVDDELIFDIIFANKNTFCSPTSQNTTEENNQNICVFTLRKNDLIKQLNFTKNIGVKIASLDIDSYALLRAITFTISLSNNPLDIYFFIYEQQQQLQLIAFNQYELLHETHLGTLSYHSSIDVIQQNWRTLQLQQPNYCLKQIYLLANQQNILPIINPSLANLVVVTNPWQPFTCNIEIKNNEYYIAMLIALGLALRGIKHANN